MRQRDFQHHTYADYLVWSAASGNEVIDGVAYVREPPSPSALHQVFVLELEGRTALTTIPGVSIDWDVLPVT